MRAIALGWALIAAPAAAQPPAPVMAPVMADDNPWVGDYVQSKMELVAQLRLNADGTFLYALTVGSLDERARGRWRVEGGGVEGERVVLTSDPRPKPPEIAPGPVAARPGPFAIRVVTAKRRDFEGVDFRIDFTGGSSLSTSYDGTPWTVPAEETARPRAITFDMPRYRIRSGPFPLDAKPGTMATFVVTANDFGVADLTGSYATRAEATLTLHRPEGTQVFRRIDN